jgi:hypothetical protein
MNMNLKQKAKDIFEGFRLAYTCPDVALSEYIPIIEGNLKEVRDAAAGIVRNRIEMLLGSREGLKTRDSLREETVALERTNIALSNLIDTKNRLIDKLDREWIENQKEIARLKHEPRPLFNLLSDFKERAALLEIALENELSKLRSHGYYPDDSTIALLEKRKS